MGLPKSWSDEQRREYYKEAYKRTSFYNEPEKRIEIYANRNSRRAQLRKRVLEHFGHKCIRCGFADERALQLDHVNGGGNKELEFKGAISVMYRALREPGEFQLLCANCNMIKAREQNAFNQRRMAVNV